MAVPTRENARSIRPRLGLEPKHLVGKLASRDTLSGTPLSWNLIAG